MLDFSNINDEQLVQLAKEVFTEALRRGDAVAAATMNVGLSASEAAQIREEEKRKLEALQKKKAEEEERERIKAKLKQEEIEKAFSLNERLWAKKVAVLHSLRQWGIPEKIEVNLWSRGTDIRVYINSKKDTGYNWSIVYYVTGNAYQPPGYLEADKEQYMEDDNILKQDNEVDWGKLMEWCKTLHSHWNKFKEDSSILEKTNIKPYSKHLDSYYRALGISNE